ncbi:Uncharacterised protein [Streptococcus pneumoniae]|nr:Uncharacterised protein [Streptococcus pneumoniae]CNA46985.1 Uncharacterised protein [Streptococcus pneumoniae]
MVGKSTISGTSVVLNTKKSLSQVWMSPSILLRLENCVAISLGKICWTSSKLAGESSNRSLSCCDFVHRPFFQRGALSQYRLLSLRVCQECLSLFTNLTCLWAWPIKSPISLRLRCIQPLSKLRVCLRLSMWEQ